MSFESLLLDCQRKLLQDLRKLSTEELTKMANSPFLLDIWIKKEEKVTSFLKSVDSHRKVTENYREINRKLKNQIATKHDALRDKRISVKKLKNSLERLKKEKNEAEEAHSFYALINVLEVMGSEADEESERIFIMDWRPNTLEELKRVIEEELERVRQDEQMRRQIMEEFKRLAKLVQFCIAGIALFTIISRYQRAVTPQFKNF
uniref:VPS37 C-terminal domain-containing protein n=1 Tax=Bursaphelenchus xylophilus TaxID=6326 RepID=A0A1I7SGV9_BURXY